MKLDYYNRLKASLISPLTIMVIVFMLLNDHFLKGSGLLPGVLTGKISDFAFLFFAPIVIGCLLRANSLKIVLLSYFIPALLFIMINISPYFAKFFDSLFSNAVFTMHTWPDITDLTALTVLPLSFYYVMQRKMKKIVYSKKNIFEFAVIALACVTCLATSQRRPPTHKPMYMSWDDLRKSVKITAPRPVLHRGKIYVKGNYLFVNEPNEGIHVFDNHNKKKPVAKLFIKIPGNVDIAVKGSILYADSFVDLLVFQLSMFPKDIRLIRRLKDVYTYDPYQVARPKDRFYPEKIDDEKGVVIGWRRVR